MGRSSQHHSSDGSAAPSCRDRDMGSRMGLARSGHAAEARAEIDRLRQIEDQLRTSGNEYWATQVEILKREVMAWSAQAEENRRKLSS